MDSWYNGDAPSSELRRRFHHDPARCDEFSRRYFAELEVSRAAWSSLAVLVDSGNVVLLCSARDERHSSEEALPDYLESKLQE